MIPLTLTGLRHVLAVGAHSDDVEIGCAGLLYRIAEAAPACRFTFLVLTGTPERCDEARRSAAALLGPGRAPRVECLGLTDGTLPYEGAVTCRRALAALRDADPPDLVLTHRRDDLHQDHRLAAEIALQTFRDHLLMEYEVPKYDGDMGRPNVLVPLEAALVERKVAHLMAHFASQRSKRWFTEELFRGLMRLRGVEAAAGSGYAEGFVVHKAVLLPDGG